MKKLSSIFCIQIILILIFCSYSYQVEAKDKEFILDINRDTHKEFKFFLYKAKTFIRGVQFEIDFKNDKTGHILFEVAACRRFMREGGWVIPSGKFEINLHTMTVHTKSNNDLTPLEKEKIKNSVQLILDEWYNSKCSLHRSLIRVNIFDQKEFIDKE